MNFEEKYIDNNFLLIQLFVSWVYLYLAFHASKSKNLIFSHSFLFENSTPPPSFIKSYSVSGDGIHTYHDLKL